MPESEIIQQLLNSLLKANLQDFPVHGRPTEHFVSCKKGVYIINSASGDPSHVRNTTRGREGVCQRLNNHLGGSSSFSRKFLQANNVSLRSGYPFRYIITDNARQRALLEALAIGGLWPEHVGTHEKVLQ